MHWVDLLCWVEAQHHCWHWITAMQWGACFNGALILIDEVSFVLPLDAWVVCSILSLEEIKAMPMFKGGISLGGHQWRIQGGSMASVTSKTDWMNAPYPKMMMTIDHNTNIYSAWQNFNERLKVVNRVARGWGLSRALGCVQVPAQLCCGPPLSCKCLHLPSSGVVLWASLFVGSFSCLHMLVQFFSASLVRSVWQSQASSYFCFLACFLGYLKSMICKLPCQL